MAHVFKNYKKFEALREDLKVEISDFAGGQKSVEALVGGVACARERIDLRRLVGRVP